MVEHTIPLSFDGFRCILPSYLVGRTQTTQNCPHISTRMTTILIFLALNKRLSGTIGLERVRFKDEDIVGEG